jgi:hypothetical protein
MTKTRKKELCCKSKRARRLTCEENRVSKTCLHSMKLAVVNAFLCSPATAPENSLDDTKKVCQVGTPSVECCSKSKFSPREKLGVNIELSGSSQKSSCRSSSSNLQNNSSFLCPQLHRVVIKHKM